jgi:hypothetical protein
LNLDDPIARPDSLDADALCTPSRVNALMRLRPPYGARFERFLEMLSR